MPQLTPPLPRAYRHHALAALHGLMARAKGDITHHTATAERQIADGKEATARANLGLAERVLALLRGRQRFLRSDESSQDGG